MAAGVIKVEKKKRQALHFSDEEEDDDDDQGGMFIRESFQAANEMCNEN